MTPGDGPAPEGSSDLKDRTGRKDWMGRKGWVEVFDAEVGLGQVRAEDGLLLPFHCTQIVDGSRTIAVGTEVRFALAAGQLGIWEARAVAAVPA